MDQYLQQIVKRFAKETKKILNDNLVAVYLYGSYVQGTQSTYSDLDVLIIVRKSDIHIRRELSDLSSKFSLKYGVCISPVLKEISIWNKNKDHNTLFYQEILQNSVRLC